MAKLPKLDIATLGARERVLLFCVASGTDWQRAGVTGETVTAMVVRGLVVRDAQGRLALTDAGRAALRALLPGGVIVGGRPYSLVTELAREGLVTMKALR